MPLKCPTCREPLDHLCIDLDGIENWPDEPRKPGTGNVPDFVGERCIPTPGIRTTFRDLRDAYLRWCLDNRLRTCGRMEFGRSLDTLGFYSVKGSRNVTCRSGISLRP